MEIKDNGADYLGKENLLRALTRLRYQVHGRQINELEQRRRENPEFTEEEHRLGVYVEEIEHQVRPAVLDFNRKGYSTFSSGFYGHSSELQVIEGHFKLDDDTQEKLRATGIEVKVEPSWKYQLSVKLGEGLKIPEDATYLTTIQFRPQIADLQEIENQWRQIADVIPDRGTPALPDWAKSQEKTR